MVILGDRDFGTDGRKYSVGAFGGREEYYEALLGWNLAFDARNTILPSPTL